MPFFEPNYPQTPQKQKPFWAFGNKWFGNERGGNRQKGRQRRRRREKHSSHTGVMRSETDAAIAQGLFVAFTLVCVCVYVFVCNGVRQCGRQEGQCHVSREAERVTAAQGKCGMQWFTVVNGWCMDKRWENELTVDGAAKKQSNAGADGK